MFANILKKYRSRKLVLLLFDILCYALVAVFYYVGTKLFDNSLSYQLQSYAVNSCILLFSMLAWRFIFGIYSTTWRYTSTFIYLKMILADAAGGVSAILISHITTFYYDVWLFVIVASLSALMGIGSRLVYRMFYRHRSQIQDDDGTYKIPVAIVGAGQLGALLAEELLYSKHSKYKPLFFIDRDTTKVGSRVAGLKVYGEDEHIVEFVKMQGVSEIFIALTGLDSDTAAGLYERYSKTMCKIKIYDLPFKDAEPEDEIKQPQKGHLHDFRIEDLLFRKSLSFNNPAAFQYYSGKKVLVTGGGGSIGSELCRQIAKCRPAQLIILDIYENNAYDIQQDLTRQYGERLNLAVEIASVRDRERLDAIFNRYRPDIVFHAAAHKHVPLMEHSAGEAIKNNVLGTYNTADMAEKYNVCKFILVSTDKAVNPTNIMGASKRMCEMIVQCRTDSKTAFAAVRFGNVLGSNGSVIPLFRKQIAEGGPVTITDKRIIRYFMTIPEASQLVVQAGAMAKKGELFVLDMGKPVRIYDLAVNMIRLCGYTPNVDIKIEEVGLRPGEKLYEELLIKTETLSKTENSMIFVETDAPLSRDAVQHKIDRLCRAVARAEQNMDSDVIRAALHETVPTFREPEEVNKDAAASDEMKQARVKDESKERVLS
ncbi:MAG: polysaccharide biosynthesis protein [Clostridia bacterium]|nr:polysaccharide biosynthesis protein [Clostridia bacterium]